MVDFKKHTKQATNGGFNFGDLSGYSAGGGIPEGDYIWKSLGVMMFAGTKQDGTKVGPERLGCMITMAPLSGGEDRQQFYSFGTNAHQSWAPNPENGKSIIAVPGGPGTPPGRSTNWALLIDSLYNSGLPQGILEGDLSVLDGIWVHMHNIPEPEERKAFVSKTGEATQDRKSNSIAVVSEIKEDGKPWEGGGGIPATKEASAQPKTMTKTVANPVTMVKTTAKVTAPVETEGESIEDIARNGISTVLSANMDPKGNLKPLVKLQLRTSTFKVISSSHPDSVQEVIDTYFSNDANLNSLLGQLGFQLAGQTIKAA